MRVHVVDPSAYTPPYDHALCSALAAEGVEVTLYTSRFAHGGVPAAVGYRRRETFYRLAARARSPRLRRALKLAEHAPDMLSYARHARSAEIVHFQWLALQQLDGLLLPRGRPLVLTAHDILPREPTPGQRRAQRRLYRHFDAVIAHSRHGARRLTEELGVDPARVHVIPHGAFEHLTGSASSLPRDAGDGPPVVLFFGLMRPYKGLDVLLDAWGRGSTGPSCGSSGCHGWTPPSFAPERPSASASTSASSPTRSSLGCSGGRSWSCSPTARPRPPASCSRPSHSAVRWC